MPWTDSLSVSVRSSSRSSPVEFPPRLTPSSPLTRVCGIAVPKVVCADLVEGTIAKAHQLIDLYKSLGVDKERVLIKVSWSSWVVTKADM
jgi:hypothetical protein